MQSLEAAILDDDAGSIVHVGGAASLSKNRIELPIPVSDPIPRFDLSTVNGYQRRLTLQLN